MFINWFYDKEIEIYEYNEYEDEYGFPKEGYKNLGNIYNVDIQPYSMEKAEKDYGYAIECNRRIYCDVIDEIKEDVLIKYNDKFYSIVKIMWDDGYYEILLNETKDVTIIE